MFIIIIINIIIIIISLQCICTDVVIYLIAAVYLGIMCLDELKERLVAARGRNKQEISR